MHLRRHLRITGGVTLLSIRLDTHEVRCPGWWIADFPSILILALLGVLSSICLGLPVPSAIRWLGSVWLDPKGRLLGGGQGNPVLDMWDEHGKQLFPPPPSFALELLQQ